MSPHIPIAPTAVASAWISVVKRRRLRRRLAQVGVGCVALVVRLAFASIGDNRLIGFRYAAQVDTAATVCPDLVVSQNGSSILLADGRSFLLDIDASALTEELAEAENRLFIDASSGEVYRCRRVGYAGCDYPQSNQRWTLPVSRVVLPTHARKFMSVIRSQIVQVGG